MNSVGLIESFPRAFLLVQGADGAKFLHNLLTHDIKGLIPGQGRPACLLDRQGKIRFWALVHALPDQLILEMEPQSLSTAQEALAQYLVTEAVELKDLSSSIRAVSLHGPLSEKLLGSLYPQAKLPSSSVSNSPGPSESGITRIIRWDFLGVPGFHLWVGPQTEEEIRKGLIGAGKPLGLGTIGPEEFEGLRIEAGVPWPGKEITSDVILNELGSEELVSFTKGCYVGQEIVARIKYRAHPPRMLTGFTLEGNALAPLPAPIEVDGKPVGVITSACFSPMRKRVLALGFLKHGLDAVSVMVKAPAGWTLAQVTSLPFTSNI